MGARCRNMCGKGQGGEIGRRSVLRGEEGWLWSVVQGGVKMADTQGHRLPSRRPTDEGKGHPESFRESCPSVSVNSGCANKTPPAAASAAGTCFSRSRGWMVGPRVPRVSSGRKLFPPPHCVLACKAEPRGGFLLYEDAHGAVCPTRVA